VARVREAIQRAFGRTGRDDTLEAVIHRLKDELADTDGVDPSTLHFHMSVGNDYLVLAETELDLSRGLAMTGAEHHPDG
jgi:hypothetical protein